MHVSCLRIWSNEMLILSKLYLGVARGVGVGRGVGGLLRALKLSYYLVITYFRATLISRIWNKNISWDLKFAILTNQLFLR